MEWFIEASLGRTLTSLRRGAGLSQRELAAKLQIERTYISKVESGHTIPRIETLQKISGALGMKLSTVIAVAEIDAEKVGV